ncbi:serine hydrolase FSH [Paraphoma chrysanthemicola]|nr:serine hydrolase FSH [Paraphoma chrysanthemicola]
MASSSENATATNPFDETRGSNSGGAVKPTLLAFHGSGSNATVHRVQLARLMRVTNPYFEIEVLEAPFPSPAGPGVLPFFDGCGPFKRWLPPTEKVSIETMRNGGSTSGMSVEVETLVRETVLRIRSEGGKVVGLIGFSQGTKVVAGLLRASDLRRTLPDLASNPDLSWCDFSFALSVCASYPPPLFPPSITAQIPSDQAEALLKEKIKLPAFHVQGAQDEWNWAGRGMIERFYDVSEGGKSELVEWEMGHHYPVKPEESQRIGEWLIERLREVEVESAGGKTVR